MATKEQDVTQAIGVDANVRSAARQSGICLGRIVGLDQDGSLWLELAGTTQAVVGQLATPMKAARIHQAIESRQTVVLLLEASQATFPIVIGLIEAPDMDESPKASTAFDASVDGKRMRIVAEDEIVLECGAASITLRRNGRVIVRGTHVESRSEGTNRIKGGQVCIN